MSFVQASSDGIGQREATYHVCKYRIRKQWCLTVHTPDVTDVAAYFRDENHARLFATVFGLTIKDHDLQSSPSLPTQEQP